LLVISSCSTKIKTPKYESPNVDSEDIDVNNARLSEISDIPIPSKSIIDLEKTFILGKGDDWMGRLSLINKENIDEIYTFFLNEMPKFKFKEKSSIRSEVSTLIFENKKKAIFIKISKIKFGKTYIEITATPVN
tara:strand:+ start:744 stop:1145 length:402 start_codon:yes stop_codon:yes gene_type:complete